MSETPEKFLIDERTAAKRLSVSVATLARLRKRQVINRHLIAPDSCSELLTFPDGAADFSTEF